MIQIVDYFTEGLLASIPYWKKGSKEDLGLKTVVFADGELARTMTALYEEYAKEIGLGILWNAENELGDNAVQNRKDYSIAYIECLHASSVFELALQYKKETVNVVQQPPCPIQTPRNRWI